jgi:uncharacterized protein (DUF433 family)
VTPLSEMPSRNQQILEAAQSGESRYDIAKRFDLTAQRVSQIVCGMGWTFR